jgi:hypothetical protein
MTDKQLLAEYREFLDRLEALDKREDFDLDEYDSERNTLLTFIRNREKKMVRRFIEITENDE